MGKLQAFIAEGHRLIFLPFVPNFLMTFFCSLEFKKGHRLAIPVLHGLASVRDIR